MIKFRPSAGFVRSAALAASRGPEGGPWAELVSSESSVGAYVAWLLSPQSADSLSGWCRLMGLRDSVPPEDMHATVIYAPDGELDPCMHGDRPLPRPVELSRFNNPTSAVLGRPGSAGALVTRYDSEALASRHRYWRDEHGLKHSFPSYTPHVTVSYDAESVPQDVRRRVMANPYCGPLAFDRERIVCCE